MVKPTFLEFFAGAGMARIGLGSDWRCLFANDIDLSKAEAYRANFRPADELLVADVASVSTKSVPGQADMAWASFPCQDLSLAGNGAGLDGGRSGTFWPFWRLIMTLRNEGRAPRLVALENVYGTLKSHGGRDFRAIVQALVDGGYKTGALVIDAVHFLPQSRPRLFVIGWLGSLPLSPKFVGASPQNAWHSRAIVEAFEALSATLKGNWVWWRVPLASAKRIDLADIIEPQPQDVEWHSTDQTAHLIEMMTPLNRAKVDAAKRLGRPLIGTIYRRTRPTADGRKRQRAEVRFDGIAGCLRTPAGGSSRQTILVVDGQSVRSRLLSAREAARLMGLPERYKLPLRYNDAYHLAGDGVVVPVVRHLAKSLLRPLLDYQPPSNSVRNGES